MKRTPDDQWTHCPDPHHFAGSAYCHFSLATRVGDWIVSTVGEYRPRPGAEVEPFSFYPDGPGDPLVYYETMVFPAPPLGDDDCPVGLPSIWTDRWCAHRRTREEAEVTHQLLCQVFADPTAEALLNDWEGTLEELIEAPGLLAGEEGA